MAASSRPSEQQRGNIKPAIAILHGDADGP
jgi:hypothetical protein